jgi:HD-GYP domain-containing protein (c-di-GMP phosphodiesterase class II)
MLTSASKPSSAAERFITGIDAALRDSLSSNYQLWYDVDRQWISWPSLEILGGTSCSESEKLRDLLTDAAKRLAPADVYTSPGEKVIAIPFALDDMVVVATTRLAAEDLLPKLAVALQRTVVLFRELEESRGVSDDCIRQISDDLDQVRYLQTLGKHLHLCEATSSPLKVAQDILPVLRELIRAESLVFIANKDAPGDYRATCDGHDASVVRAGSEKIDAAVCMELVRRYQDAAERRPVAKNRLKGRIDGLVVEGLNGFLLISVVKDDLTIGWLLALNRQPDLERRKDRTEYPPWGLSDDEFGTVEAGLISAAAGMLATHAGNVKLFREKENLLIGVLRALINAMDAKDSYTCGHSERVALVAREIGKELALSAEECNAIYISGLLHDIGKIGVPDAILLKPGKLTDVEFTELQKHPERSHDILKHLDHLARILPGVLHHHEQFNGLGYPQGLQGDNIPLSARIIAVADSYDAMSSNRPYRSAMPESRVEAILREGSGKQWDPRVIEAFFRILPEIRVICESAEIRSQVINPNSSSRPKGESGTPDNLVAALTATLLP